MNDNITLKVRFPVVLGQPQDYKILKFAKGSTIKDVIRIVASRINLDEFHLEVFGIYLPPNDPNMGGTWLHEERSLGSYNLNDMDLVEFKGKSYVIPILIDITQTTFRPTLEIGTTVAQVSDFVVEKLKLKKERDFEYVLFDACDSTGRGLDPNISLRAQIRPTNNLILKRQPKPKRRDLERNPQLTKNNKIIFGYPLVQLCNNSSRTGTLISAPTLPSVVRHCVDYLARHGMDVEGIFRLGGNLTEINELKRRYDSGEDVDISSCKDAHVVAGLLKLYLRDLPDPPITYSLYPFFAAAHHITKPNNHNTNIKSNLLDLRVRLFRGCLLHLPQPHHVLLDQLLSFIVLLQTHKEQTKMETKNLALIFAPNLLRQPPSSSSSSSQQQQQQLLQQVPLSPSTQQQLQQQQQQQQQTPAPQQLPQQEALNELNEVGTVNSIALTLIVFIFFFFIYYFLL